LVEAMLDAGLVALRNGTLDELGRQRPHAVRFLTRRFRPASCAARLAMRWMRRPQTSG